MRALLFARLRELAGTDSAEASGATVREAWESLRARFPELPEAAVCAAPFELPTCA